jgi:ribonuclease I
VLRLENEWPNLSDGESDFSLWEREWDRHGKCSLDIFHNQLNYFRTTLMLNTQVDITSILISENKIMPSDTSLYDTQHIVDAITIDFGVPQLECIEESNPPILRAIRLCYGRNLSSIDCPYKRLNINCGVQLKWPSTSSGLNSINSSSGLNSCNLYFLIPLFIVFII